MHRRHLAPTLFTIVVSIVVAMSVAAAVAPGAAHATPISDKKAKLKAVKQQVEALDTRLEIAVEQYNLATSRLAIVQQQIKVNQAKLDEAQHNLRIARVLLGRRVVSLYKERDTDFLDVLLETKTFDDLVSAARHDAARERERLGRRRLHREAQEGDRRARRAAGDRQEAGREAGQPASLGQAEHRRLARPAQATRLRARERDQAHERPRPARLVARRSRPPRLLRPSVRRRRRSPARSAPLGRRFAPLGRQHRTQVPRRAVRLGRRQAERLRLLRPGHVRLRPARHLAAAQRRQSQYSYGTPIVARPLQPGDLVFFGYSAASIHHVGIYAGGGSMIDAPYTGAVVRYDARLPRDYYGASRP